MKKFLKIELGSRGEVENVEVVNTTYELVEDEYDYKYDDLSKDSDNIPYLEEFASIDTNEEKGVVLYGFSEEDTTYYIDFDKNEDLCEMLISNWESENEDFSDCMEELYFQLQL